MFITKPSLWRELRFWYRVWRLPTVHSRWIAIGLYRQDRQEMLRQLAIEKARLIARRRVDEEIYRLLKSAERLHLNVGA